MTQVVAIDLGATSVRVALVEAEAAEPAPRILHRFAHHPRRDAGGVLRWDWGGILDAIDHGLSLAARADEPIASIGIETWGVDYGLISASGKLIASPVSYRDERTDSWERIADRIGVRELYRRTGVIPAAINTIFQLASHDRAELESTHRLLMLPELVAFHLTGQMRAERSSAGTSGLVDLATGQWSQWALDAARIRLDSSRFEPIRDAGTLVGVWESVPVILVNGHDTASAVAALPPTTRPRAFVSSGSWLVVGAETRAAVTSDAALAAGLSNEPGPGGVNLLIDNLPGFVIVERLLDHWGRPDLPTLLDQADRLAEPARSTLSALQLVDLAGGPLERSLSAGGDTSRPQVLATALQALAVAVGASIRSCSDVSGIEFQEIVLVGGGARIPLFVRLLRDATGLPVIVGHPESAAIGNARQQGIALGVVEAPSPLVGGR